MAMAWLREVWPCLTGEFYVGSFNSSPTEPLEEMKLHYEAIRRMSIKAQKEDEEGEIAAGEASIEDADRRRADPSIEVVGEGPNNSAWYFGVSYTYKPTKSPIEAVGRGDVNSASHFGVGCTCRLIDLPMEVVDKGIELSADLFGVCHACRPTEALIEADGQGIEILLSEC
eukprot:Gb_30247 [translate_table: standard]